MKALLCFQGLSWAIVLGERYHVYTTAKQNRKNVSGVWRTGRKVRIFLGYGGIGLGARYGSAELNTKAPLKEQMDIDLVVDGLQCAELSNMALPFARSRPKNDPQKMNLRKRKRKVPKSGFDRVTSVDTVKLRRGPAGFHANKRDVSLSLGFLVISASSCLLAEAGGFYYVYRVPLITGLKEGACSSRVDGEEAPAPACVGLVRVQFMHLAWSHVY